MSTLYELTGEYMELMSLMEDDSIDDQMIQDTLEGVEGEIEEKADAIAKIIKSAKTEAEVIEREEKRLNSRKKMLLNNADRLKDYLEKVMRTTGKTKFKTALFGFGIQKNPPTVVIDNEANIPEEFWIVKDPVIDKTALKQYLKENGEVDFAHLHSTESLRIR